METPIRKALNAVLTRASNTARPPISLGQSGGLLTNNSASSSGGTQERMNAMGSVGWLFAVIERISTSMAASEWKLYYKRGNDLDEVESHPLLDLWNSPNPFYSQSELFEDSSNHFELTGEMAWVIVRGLGGAIVELWPVRPDRIRPVPNEDDYIQGYIYQVGTNQVPLDADDVVFMRRPHPTIPYRGIGPVQSLLHDLGSEQMASAWQRNFFANSALPGGIIEFDHNLSTQDFTRLVDRWRDQHQGVSNSHRVAIIERGKWQERKFSQRDMEFKETRMLNRDLILGAFGFPHALLGISEDVNRANAEAAEVMFGRWLIRPRLIRIRDKINQTLVKQFDPNLYLDFVDPVPANQEGDLEAGERGYNAGILTQNEARERLGESAIPEGDDFKAEPAHEPSPVNPFPPIAPPEDEEELLLVNQGYGVEKQDGPTALLPTVLEYVELEMQRGWTRRLRHEMLSIISDLSMHVRSPKGIVRKIELSDLDHHIWDWEERFGDDVRAELESAFEASLKMSGFYDGIQMESADKASPEIIEAPISFSQAYARHRAAQLLALETALDEQSVVNVTRRRVRSLVAQAVDRGDSIQDLTSSIRADHVFSPSRAEAISRTETSMAMGQGGRRTALSKGHDEKRWLTRGDDAVDRGSRTQPCINNASQGWIPLRDLFTSGNETIPSHPRCRCIVEYRTREYEDIMSDVPNEELPKTIDQARCQGTYRGKTCNKLLQKNYVGGTLYCSRCKQETIFTV
jgi:HK97 family phage portal protein